LIHENKHDDEIIAEKMKVQNEKKIALLRKALELDNLSGQNDLSDKMDES